MNAQDDFPGSETDCERKAIALGNDRTALRKRLNEGVRILYGESPARWRFDFAARTLTSPDGLRAVKWQVRRDPAAPISYSNQQTSTGLCARLS
jgi:hypothetical protein